MSDSPLPAPPPSRRPVIKDPSGGVPTPPTAPVPATPSPPNPHRYVPPAASVPTPEPAPDLTTVPQPANDSRVVGVPTAVNSSNVLAQPKVREAAQRLLDYIADDTCSEVLLNGPNECSIKIKGGRYHCPEVAFGDATTYHAVLDAVVLKYCDTPDRIDGSKPIVEGQLELPAMNGKAAMHARVHMVTPPGVKFAKVTIAKKPRVDITLDDMAAGGALSADAAEFLKAVARGHKTFVVSGGTGTGKTTLLQALSYYFDVNDRIIVVEETPELRLPQADVVYLKSALELPGMDPKDKYTLEFWVKQANRMRMDRIIVGETRGAEMAEWLVAANSGANGSATTVHAENPRRCLDKILTLASKAENSTSEQQLRREIAATVDVIIQAGLVDGRHVITAIEEISDTVASQTGQIQTNTLFEFDLQRNHHVVRSRPSDGFAASLSRQGVPLAPHWFKNPTPR